MKKIQQNQIDKKKKILNLPKEKTDEKEKEKKILSSLIPLEKQNPLIQSSNNPRGRKINNLTDLATPPLTRKKSEQKYRVDNKYFEDKYIKRDKPRLFSHSPEHFDNQINPSYKPNKPKLLQHKNLTERKFNPTNIINLQITKKGKMVPITNTINITNIGLNTTTAIHSVKIYTSTILIHFIKRTPKKLKKLKQSFPK